MKFIITESKLHKAALHWMNKNYNPDQLEVVEYTNTFRYRKNNKTIMITTNQPNYFYVSYESIWSFLNVFFLMDDFEIRDFLNMWFKKSFQELGLYRFEGFFYEDEFA